MVQGRVNQDTGIIPSSALDTNSLVQSAHLLKGLGDNCNVVLAEQGTVQTVIRPNNILNTTDCDLSQLLLLLNIEENHGGRSNEQEAASAAKVDVRCTGRGLDSLGRRVAEILDVDLLVGWVEHRKAVTGNENSRCGLAALDIGGLDCASGIAR